MIMFHIVLDLEWNQPEKLRDAVKKPVFLHGEIIQIGAVKLDEDRQFLETFTILVTPQCYTKLHEAVADLTHLTEEQLQEGVPFPEALERFREWCGNDFDLLTWGPTDIDILGLNLLFYGLDTDWVPKVYDIQKAFGAQIIHDERQHSLMDAMRRIEKMPYAFHDALNDALNTACVCQYLNLDLMEPLEHTAFMIKPKRAARRGTYPTRAAAFADRRTVCFPYGDDKKLLTCSGVQRQNNEKYIALGVLEDGTEMFVRFIFHRRDDGLLSVSRTVYKLDEEKRSYYEKMKRKNKRRNVYYWMGVNSRR